MSDQVENRKVEWRKIRSCIRSQFDEPMKDERKKEKEKQGKLGSVLSGVLSCIPTRTAEECNTASKPLS